jgi:hypothetical protein
MFVCPACKSVHQCDHRWGFNGDVERPSFSGSVLVHGDSSIGRPHCHSVVTNGRIAYGADSTHAFAGQTLDLPDWDFARPLGGAKD